MIWNQRIDINTVYSDYRNTRLSSRSWGSVRGSCVDIVHNARWSIMYAETNIWPQLTKTTIYTSISLYRCVVTYCNRLIYIYYQLLYSCIVVHIVCIYRHICFLISSHFFFFLNKRMHACMHARRRIFKQDSCRTEDFCRYTTHILTNIPTKQASQ